jgi:hypothetical protein
LNFFTGDGEEGNETAVLVLIILMAVVAMFAILFLAGVFLYGWRPAAHVMRIFAAGALRLCGFKVELMDDQSDLKESTDSWDGSDDNSDGSDDDSASVASGQQSYIPTMQAQTIAIADSEASASGTGSDSKTESDSESESLDVDPDSIPTRDLWNDLASHNESRTDLRRAAILQQTSPRSIRSGSTTRKSDRYRNSELADSDAATVISRNFTRMDSRATLGSNMFSDESDGSDVEVLTANDEVEQARVQFGKSPRFGSMVNVMRKSESPVPRRKFGFSRVQSMGPESPSRLVGEPATSPMPRKSKRG